MRRIKFLLLALLVSVQGFAQDSPLSQRSIKSNHVQNKSFEAKRIHFTNHTTQNWNTLERLYTIEDLVIRENEHGIISNISQKVPLGQLQKEVNPTQGMTDFLKTVAGQTSIESAEEFELQNQEKDELGFTHAKYDRVISGIRVFGGEVILSSDRKGAIEARGQFFGTPSVSKQSMLSESNSISIGEKATEDHWHMNHSDARWALSAGEETVVELIWFEVNAELRKAYIVDVHPNYLEWIRIIIDAHSGKILRQYEKTCTVDGPKTANAKDLNNQSRKINTYQVGSNYYLIDASKSMFSSSRSTLPSNPEGAIWTLDAKNTDGSSVDQVTSSNNSWIDKSSVSAHYNSSQAFDYFKNTHGRNSINGSGGSMISVVNVTDENGLGLDNAYWNGKAMFYGNGRVGFKPLAGSQDVAGHEMTHGLVSSTANLEYYSQSGAINESMADVFGAMMDKEDWKMGEDVVKTNVFKSGALRDLSDPHNGGTNRNHNGYQPKKMSEYYAGEDDNQGVHINSGIPNYAFYLIASDIGTSKAEKIYYRALTRYLTSSSEFLDLRYAIVKAASDLHGGSGVEVSSIKSAFDEVEIFDPNSDGGSTGGGGSGDTIVLQTNPGTEFILSLDIDNFNSNSLYQSNTKGENFEALSTTKFRRKPSVLDDGSACFFVNTSKEIKRIDLKGTIKESVISPDVIWDNVAISKDGKRLAAVTENADSSIYVYDFESQKWKVFQLYNPTYTEGVNVGGVLYADAIEFDNTGQFVLYDARNLIKNPNGSDIDYWDIGLIRVWDISEDTWGDGKVEKLYNQLAKDVDIGNPTYSSNSPHIIAFDYIDKFSNEFAVLAKNTATGKTGTILNNTRLSYPDYSNDDKKMLFDARTQGGLEVVAVVDLRSDKISGTGTPLALIGDAKWGVWYADGSRTLLSSGKDLLSFGFPALDGAPKAEINGTTASITVPFGTDLSSLIPTFTTSSFSEASVGGSDQISGVTAQNYSNEILFKVTAQNLSTKTYRIKVEVESNTGIDPSKTHIPTIYPNPTTGLLHIHGLFDGGVLRVYDGMGKVLMESEIGKTATADLSFFRNGIYQVVISTKYSEVHRRIIKL